MVVGGKRHTWQSKRGTALLRALLALLVTDDPGIFRCATTWVG
jgi:hypothetical protein